MKLIAIIVVAGRYAEIPVVPAHTTSFNVWDMLDLYGFTNAHARGTLRIKEK